MRDAASTSTLAPLQHSDFAVMLVVDALPPCIFSRRHLLLLLMMMMRDRHHRCCDHRQRAAADSLRCRCFRVTWSRCGAAHPLFLLSTVSHFRIGLDLGARNGRRAQHQQTSGVGSSPSWQPPCLLPLAVACDGAECPPSPACAAASSWHDRPLCRVAAVQDAVDDDGAAGNDEKTAGLTISRGNDTRSCFWTGSLSLLRRSYCCYSCCCCCCSYHRHHHH